MVDHVPRNKSAVGILLRRGTDPGCCQTICKVDAQVIAAQEHAIELLHDVTMKNAIEGECEPVFWQGIPVGHIKRVDNRLRVELPRTYMPKTFNREQRLLSKQEAIAKTCSSVAPMKFNSSKTRAVKPWNGWKRKRWRCPSRTAD